VLGPAAVAASIARRPFLLGVEEEWLDAQRRRLKRLREPCWAASVLRDLTVMLLVTSSDCAGSLEGIDAFGSQKIPDYAPIQKVMTQMRELYMALRHQFGDQVEIDVVDPRNEIYLIPRLFSDYRRHTTSLRTFLKTLFFGIAPGKVIINGRVRNGKELPSPETLIQEVQVYVDESTETRGLFSRVSL
jgi:hypothetical protein